MVCTLHGFYDARPKMCFSPSPPSPTPKATFSSNLTFGYKCNSDHISIHNNNYYCQDYNNNNNVTVIKEQENMQRPEDLKIVNGTKTDEESTSDYKQWLHAMKLVARLPGGIPPEFRRKLWLSLADKYLKSKNVNWTKEEEKCFCEKWREDDEELGIQIVKDLHRTGSTLCTGPAGDLNQAKLKKILLGYARYNPEVGYCQGFNMLGALILQVMDKDESESIKVMIYLVEGILPTGYFCGSMGGLQTDMAVFRELMQTKLPRLAKHLQKLQGPVENAYEPPLTNVFTMQWFLTMFCTCLPMSCVLRVWDLVLIEGSDVLLRTALALWSLLEERVLSARSADDFYGKMGSFSSELLNGHLIDSNGLIEKVVQLGPIADIQKLRDKHRNIESHQGLQLYFDDEEPDIDEDSRLAVATVWGIPWGRRGSQGQPNHNIAKQSIENKDRIALDISLLKKQYDRLRERQKQAQIILTTACSTASRQSATSAPLPVNQLLSGRPAIVTNKGRRSGPPIGAIPPARKPSLPAVLYEKPLEKQLRRGETLYWRDTKDTTHRRESLSWKEIKAERAAMITSESIDELKSQKIRTGRLGKSDSSSYSEESDDNEAEDAENASSTDTSLCDEDLKPIANEKIDHLHMEKNHKTLSKTSHKTKKSTLKQRNKSVNLKDIREKTRPKSWAPSNTEIPFVLMTTDSPGNSADENSVLVNLETAKSNILSEEKNILTENSKTNPIQSESLKWNIRNLSQMETTPFDKFESQSTTISLGGVNENGDNTEVFDISNEGVTNEYFERVNSTERPTKLDLLYSLNEDENVRVVFRIEDQDFVKSNEESRLYTNDKNLHNPNNIRCMDLLVDYSEKSSAACIEEAKTEISTTFQSVDAVSAISFKKEYPGTIGENLLKKTKSLAEKRRDPRRLTLTRSSTMDIEKRFEALEKRLSMDVCPTYKRFLDEIEFDEAGNEKPYKSFYTKVNKDNNEYSDPLDHNIDHKTPLREKNISAEKKIPSTADLEERFENIQQQLVRDRNKMIKSPSDSESTEKQPNLNTSPDNNIVTSVKNGNPSKQAKKHDENEDNEKIEGEKILSANADSEEKPSESTEFGDVDSVNSLNNTRLKSTIMHASESTKSESKTSQSKKEPPDISEDKNMAEKDITNEWPIAEIKRNANKTAIELDSKRYIRKLNSEMTEEREEIEETRNSSRKISDRTSPPDSEMTEEQEKIEETRKSSRKTSDRTSPPGSEMTEEKKEIEEIRKSSRKTSDRTSPPDSEMTQENKEIEETRKSSRKISDRTSPPGSEITEEKKEIEETHKSSRKTSDRTTPPDSEMTEAKKEIEETSKCSRKTSDRTSPPSTEELEKRFCALEKQMSSEKIVSNESPHNVQSKTQQKSAESSKKTDVQHNTSQTEPDILNDLSENVNKFELKSEKNPKRRLSEPPSTEDLEKRYEVMKRRMSSRNFETKTLHKDGLSIDLQKTNKNILNKSPTSKHSPPSLENLEERFEKLQNQNDSKRSIITPSPPSTENLEERFEKLQNKNESRHSITTQSPSSNHNQVKGSEKPQNKNDQCEIDKLSNAATKLLSPAENKNKASNKNNTEGCVDKKRKVEHEMDNEGLVHSVASNAKTSAKNVQISEENNMNVTIPIAPEKEENVSEKKKTANVLAQSANNIKNNLIEELQAKIREHSLNSEVDNSFKIKMAVIEELKKKIDPLQNKILKPTQISSRRDLPSQGTIPPNLKLNDETLESHAASAYRKSEKYEPTNSAKRKRVRRFSDLPSRADLENRLQFLEEQLSKTVCMQRRSSDSEVASKVPVTQKETLTNVPRNGSLENRVQELEKRLNDNRTLSMDIECSNANEKNNTEISQVGLGTDTVAVTGKELVRYSSHGEIGDSDHQNPINISINIQMTLNKDDVGGKKSADATKSDDLDRRLQLLEQKLKTSDMHDAFEILADNVKLTAKEKDQKLDLNNTENIDEDKKGNNQVEEKHDVELLNKTSPKSTQETSQLNNEDIDPETANQLSLVTKIDENVPNQNITEKSGESKINFLQDKFLDEKDNPCKLNETKQQIENTEAMESPTPDKLQERTDCQEQSILIKEEKELENNTYENKVVNRTKFEENPSITNSPIESIKSNLKEDKNHTNSLRQKTQTNDNERIDNPELVQLNERSKSQLTKASEPEICELNDGINNKKANNSETIIKSEIEKYMGSNQCSQMVPIEVNKKTLVLLLDNEPKAVKVRRLTRANTEELEDLFQALEKQLNDRGQQKIGLDLENKPNIASEEIPQNEIAASQAMSDLAKEIEAFSKSESKKTEPNANITKKQKKREEEFDWGSDPIKYHLKKSTVYLPSTKELEARFRSLERQIKLLEDVEKIDVEQRLIEIERKIKLQYSLSHEKDLNKFLELCDGKDPDEIPTSSESYKDQRECCSEVFDQKHTSKHTSPNRTKEPIPSSSSHEGRHRSMDLKSSMSKQSLKKQPIHPLEMLLDPSPDDRDIPTTGELEHRIRVMEGNIRTPSPSSRKSRSQSPPIKQNIMKSNTYVFDNLPASPTERDLPTAEELEARLEALEKEQCFNFKMQKNFQQFNQKLKDVVSPSLSFDELKSSTKPSDSGHSKTQACSASKQTSRVNSVSPKTIRFCENIQSLSQKEIESKKTIPENKGCQKTPSTLEGPGCMGIRLMRETSPLRRKGTHTGVPLHTGENINDQLTSIQNTIKSIDSLCEEKPYRRERCQQYIDALFSDSTHFTQKKTSLENLSSHNLSRSTSREIGPSIRVSGHSPAFTRSMGSAESIRSSSPLRSASPLQYRSNRDLRREPSPRRRREEDREEHESRLTTARRKIA